MKLDSAIETLREGDELYYRGRLSEALRTYFDVIEGPITDGDSVQHAFVASNAHYNSGLVYIEKGNIIRATEQFQLCLNKLEECEESRGLLAGVSSLRNSVKRAVRNYRLEGFEEEEQHGFLIVSGSKE